MDNYQPPGNKNKKRSVLEAPTAEAVRKLKRHSLTGNEQKFRDCDPHHTLHDSNSQIISLIHTASRLWSETNDYRHRLVMDSLVELLEVSNG